MIRDRNELFENSGEKKRSERRADRQRPFRVVGYDDLIAAEGRQWAALTTHHQLAYLAERVKLRLDSTDYPRFVAHLASVHGPAVVRRAGLALSRPQLTLAS